VLCGASNDPAKDLVFYLRPESGNITKSPVYGERKNPKQPVNVVGLKR